MAEDLTTLQTRLTEARAALHTLMTGSAEAEIENGDMRLKYDTSPERMSALRQYIADLESRVAALGGTMINLRRRSFVVNL